MSGIVDFPDLNIWDRQIFTSNGTFNVPTRVSHVLVLGAGGGSGGGGDASASGTGYGGNGAVPELISVPVTPGGTVTVTIGTGGAGNSTTGVAGNNSIFGNYTFLGAPINDGSAPVGYRPSGSFTNGGGLTEAGQQTHYAAGGVTGAGPGNSGGGGGAGYGAGGTGGATSGGGGANPTNGGISAGGGGAGAGSGDNGGNGGSGIIIVHWVKVEAE